MTTDYSKYFVPDGNAPQNSQETYASSFIPEETTGQSIGRTIGRTAKAAGSTLAGIPGDVQDLALNLVSKIYGIDPKSARSKLQLMSQEDNDIPAMFPTSQELKSGTEEFAPSLKPRTSGERKYEEAVELGTSLLGPGSAGKSILNKTVRAGVGTAAGMGGKEGLEYLGASPETQEIAKTVLSMVPMIVSGKLKPTDPEKLKIYEAGKNAGLSDKQLAPLLKEEKEVAKLTKKMVETPEKRQFIKGINESIGDFYSDIKTEGRKTRLSNGNTKLLRDKAEDFLIDLEQTVEPSTQKKTAIEYVRKSLGKLEGPMTAEKLINWYQDINAEVGHVSGAKKQIASLKGPILQSIKDADPKLGQRFQQANALWEKKSKLLDSIGWEKLENASKGSEMEKMLFAAVTGGYIDPKLVIVGPAGIMASKKIRDNLLFNPNWQNIKKNSAMALKSQSPKAILLAYNQLKDKIKQDVPNDNEK